MVSMIDIMISSTQVEEVLVEQAHGFLECQQQMYVASLEAAAPSGSCPQDLATCGAYDTGATAYACSSSGGSAGLESGGLVEVVVDSGSGVGPAVAGCHSSSILPENCSTYVGYDGLGVEAGNCHHGSFQDGPHGYDHMGAAAVGVMGGEQPIVGVQLGGEDATGEVRWLAPEMSLVGVASGQIAAEVAGVGAGGQHSGVYGSSSCYVEEQV
jgi:hypothetical protein